MKILLVEDETDLREMIQESLVKEHFLVECAANYEEAYAKIHDYEYDCVILDIMLPGGSGLSLLAKMKKLHKKDGVLIISAKDSVEDKIKGLDMGADDYLAKPFHLAELNARIKSLLRRKNAQGENQITWGNLSLFPDSRQVQVDGQPLTLNRKEFDLLYYFVSNPNRLIPKASLVESVWGDNIYQADSFDFIYSQVKNLRKKIKQAGCQIEIKAVYGVGYKLITETP